MTPTRPGKLQHDADASLAKVVLINLGIAALAIVGGMIGVLVHEWRLPAEPVRPQSQLELAVKKFQEGNNQAALTVFGKMAEDDNPVAQYWLGHMTELGLGVQRDPKKAIELYKKAAARGVVAAECRLGEAYLRGDLLLPDYAQAKMWIERAAQRGDARAAMLLGHMYRAGLGVTADPKEAYAWSEVATIEGSPFAQRDRDASLNELSAEDRQAAIARAHEIFDEIKRQVALATPVPSAP
jgi:TPR repeat protein